MRDGAVGGRGAGRARGRRGGVEGAFEVVAVVVGVVWVGGGVGVVLLVGGGAGRADDAVVVVVGGRCGYGGVGVGVGLRRWVGGGIEGEVGWERVGGVEDVFGVDAVEDEGLGVVVEVEDVAVFEGGFGAGQGDDGRVGCAG